MAKLDLSTLVLLSGKHGRREDGVCALEAVAWLADEAHTDHPQCVSPVVADFVRLWNDRLSDEDRQMLKPLLPKLVGTRSAKEHEVVRAYMLTDWLARECAPAWLRLAGLVEQAEALERLAPLLSEQDVEAARPALDRASSDAWAARSAARSAALSAAESAALSAAESAALSAAESAAESAALSAAESAALSAAESAARSAARSAAESAALSALAPTSKALQASALKLVERMCDVGRKGRAA